MLFLNMNYSNKYLKDEIQEKNLKKTCKNFKNDLTLLQPGCFWVF